MHQRYRYPRTVCGESRLPEHAGGQVHGHHPGTLPDEPPRAGSGAAADLDAAPGDRAEQVGVGLAQPFRAPHEVHVAQELAVFGLVHVGFGVPPRPARAQVLGGTDPAAGHTRLSCHADTVSGGLACSADAHGKLVGALVDCDLGREQIRGRRTAPTIFFGSPCVIARRQFRGRTRDA